MPQPRPPENAQYRIGGLAIVAALFTLHCGNSVMPAQGDASDATPITQDAVASDLAVTDAVVGDTLRRVPMNHRPDNSQCLTTPAQQNCNLGAGAPGTCHADSDCTAGTNGRCSISGADALMCACTYDTCTADSQCTMGGPCSCHGSAYVGARDNTCVAGNCHVDADCEGGSGYCSPSDATSGCGGIPAYYCHTPADTCIDDSDCASSVGVQVCAYQTTTGNWACQMSFACG